MEFKKLLNYCVLQNEKGNTPHFLIVNNPNFEYVACLHNKNYKGQEINQFLVRLLNLNSVDELKKNENIYQVLNRTDLSYQTMLEAIQGKKKLVVNTYEVKKNSFEIIVKNTCLNLDMIHIKNTNIDEFFDIIKW